MFASGEDVILMRADTAPSSPATVWPPRCGRWRVKARWCVHVWTADFRDGLLTRPACEELALREGVHLVALVKAPQVHLIPLPVERVMRNSVFVSQF